MNIKSRHCPGSPHDEFCMNLKINRLDNLAAAVLPRHQLPPKIISRQARGARTETSPWPGAAIRDSAGPGSRQGSAGCLGHPGRKGQRLLGSGLFPGTGDKSCSLPALQFSLAKGDICFASGGFFPEGWHLSLPHYGYVRLRASPGALLTQNHTESQNGGG